MLTPTPMMRVLFVILDEDLPSATEALGRQGVVHLLTIQQLGPWAGGLDWQEPDALSTTYANYRRRLQ